MKTLHSFFLTLLLFLLGMPLPSWGQEELLRKYADQPGVQFVSVGGGMVGGFPESTTDEFKIAGIPKRILVLNIENKETAEKFHAELMKLIEKEKYEILVENREKGSSSYIYLKQSEPDKKKKIQTSLIVYKREGEETQVVCLLGEKEE